VQEARKQARKDKAPGKAPIVISTGSAPFIFPFSQYVAAHVRLKTYEIMDTVSKNIESQFGLCVVPAGRGAA
jgi:hypothetical protein